MGMLRGFCDEELLGLLERAQYQEKQLRSLLRKEHGFKLIPRRNAARRLAKHYSSGDMARHCLELKSQFVGQWVSVERGATATCVFDGNHRFQYDLAYTVGNVGGDPTLGIVAVHRELKEARSSGVYLAVPEKRKEVLELYDDDQIGLSRVEYQNGQLKMSGRTFQRAGSPTC